MVGSQLLDESQNADDQRAATHENNAQNKRAGDDYPEPVINPKDETVCPRLKLLLRGKRQHDLGARPADQIGHGYEFVSPSAKRIDNLRKSGNRLAAVASAIMKKHDVPFGSFEQDILDNLRSRQLHARCDLAPVVRVHFLAD